MINVPMTSLINVSIHLLWDSQTFMAEKKMQLNWNNRATIHVELLIRPVQDGSPFSAGVMKSPHTSLALIRNSADKTS